MKNEIFSFKLQIPLTIKAVPKVIHRNPKKYIIVAIRGGNPTIIIAMRTLGIKSLSFWLLTWTGEFCTNLELIIRLEYKSFILSLNTSNRATRVGLFSKSLYRCKKKSLILSITCKLLFSEVLRYCDLAAIWSILFFLSRDMTPLFGRIMDCFWWHERREHKPMSRWGNKCPPRKLKNRKSKPQIHLLRCITIILLNYLKLSGTVMIALISIIKSEFGDIFDIFVMVIVKWNLLIKISFQKSSSMNFTSHEFLLYREEIKIASQRKLLNSIQANAYSFLLLNSNFRLLAEVLWNYPNLTSGVYVPVTKRGRAGNVIRYMYSTE